MTRFDKRYTKTTASQDRAIELVKRIVLERFSYGSPEDHELKRFEIELSEISGSVNIRFTVGQVEDEGTLAEVYARDSGILFVGRQGGIYTFTEEGKKVRGLDKALIEG